MKVTLENPPEGFEAAAEWRCPKQEEMYLDMHGDLTLATQRGSEYQDIGDRYIILTPKKRKYWRLDPVVTFGEAAPDPSQHNKGLRLYRIRSNGALGYEFKGCLGSDSDWISVTECEE